MDPTAIYFYFLQGCGLGFAAAAQPGPFQAYLMGRSLRLGWRRALPAALAPLVSDGPIILLVLLLLSQMPPWFLRGVGLVGGLFIIYLAYQAFRSFRNYRLVVPTPATSGQSLLQAALINALGPGPYIYWSLVTGPILLRAWRAAPPQGLAFLLGFYLALCISLAGLILLFAQARQFGPRLTRGMIGFSALALLGFGIYQLWNALGPGLLVR